MFGISPLEFIVVLLVAVVVVGPEKMPRIMRTLAKMFSEFRRVKTDFHRIMNLELANMENPKQPQKLSNQPASQASGQVSGQVTEQAAVQVDGQADGQAAGQVDGQAAVQADGQVSGQVGGQISGENEVADGHSGNKENQA
jgi:sec-independent protein translocase protein TatB